MRSTSLDTCCTRSEMAHPCCGPTASGSVKDQKIQCPLWKINSFFAQIITPLTSTERQIHYSFVEVQGEIKEGSLETQCWPSGCVTDNSEISWSTGANRAMRSSSRIEGDFQIPVVLPPTRTLHPFWGNFRWAVIQSGTRAIPWFSTQSSRRRCARSAISGRRTLWTKRI